MIVDIADFGLYASILALCLALLLAVLPLTGVLTGNWRLQYSAKPLSICLFVMVLIAFVCLGINFVNDDFSVKYVAFHSSIEMPLIYKLTAIWGGHEGSLLLWILMQAGWILAVALFSRALAMDTLAAALSTMGFVCAAFLFFMLFTSNPFDRLLLDPLERSVELNSALQDFAFIIHPPMLYMGYVGFSVAFGFAMAALITGRLDTAWARWARPWTNIAWVFLTVGIALGSWWAYYELGWGGWWFWDPVENASFMPWLIGTALVHSLAVTEKRGAFRSWTVLLAIAAFSYSLIGTFIVRSGLLSSVHAFATDPERGVVLLMILAITIISALCLFAIRGRSISSQVSFELYSRETFLLVNNLVLTILSLAILIGTMLPLLTTVATDEQQTAQSISVGVPVYNDIFAFGMIILIPAMVIGQLLRWKKHKVVDNYQSIAVAFVIALLIGAVMALQVQSAAWKVGLAWLLAAWIVVSLLQSILQNTRNSKHFLKGVGKLSPSYWGMVSAHLGVALAVVGAGMVEKDSLEKKFLLEVGDQVQLAQYQITFSAVEDVLGPNYRDKQGVFAVYEQGELVTTLLPAQRYFINSSAPTAEAAIDISPLEDLYITMSEAETSGFWAVHMQIKAMVRWIWLGTALMAFGGMLTLFDRRYRQTRKTQNQSTEDQLANAQTAKEALL